MQPSKRNVWLAIVPMLGLFILPTAAQSPELQQRLAEVEQSLRGSSYRQALSKPEIVMGAGRVKVME